MAATTAVAQHQAAPAAPAPASALATRPGPPVTGPVIMNGSWDGRLEEARGGLPKHWVGLQSRPRGLSPCFKVSCASHTLRLVSRPRRDGRRAARFELRDRERPFGSDERVEVQSSGTGPIGSRRWYTWSVYLPANFTALGVDADRYMYLTQWAIPKGAAPLALTVDRGHLALQVLQQSRPGRITHAYRPWGMPLEQARGRWVDFAMFVWWDTGLNGEIQLWVDGVQQTMNWPLGNDDGNPAVRGGLNTYRFVGPTTVSGAGPTYVKQGIARSPSISGTTVVVLDAMRVRAARRTPVAPPKPAG